MLRPLIVGCGVGLLAVCAFGLRFACPPTDSREADRRAELERLSRATFDRVGAKEQVVRDLIDRRCTLAEAIEAFRELDRRWPDYRTVPLADRNQDRKAYRYIRAMVEQTLRDRPEQASAVLSRLEKEYEKLRTDRQWPSGAQEERVGPRSSDTK
jgi:hypothetical protein